VAGTYINTSGTQSGTHTGFNFTTARGTGAGTTELQTVNGIRTNKNAITNGPGANLGTYVGTIYTNGSSQIDWNFGGVGAGGTPAAFSVWNAYNRRQVKGLVGDTTDSWSYAGGIFRIAGGQWQMRTTFVIGLQEDFFDGRYDAAGLGNGSSGQVSVGYNTTGPQAGASIGIIGNTTGATVLTASGQYSVQPAIGVGYFCPTESNLTAGATFYGDNGSQLQTGLFYGGWF
jgi:hypothetical protein